MLNTYYIYWISEIKTKIFFLWKSIITIYVLIFIYTDQLFSSIIHVINNKSLFNISEKVVHSHNINMKMYYWSDLTSTNLYKTDQFIYDSFDWIPSFEFNLGLDSTSDLYIYIQIITLLVIVTPYFLYLIIKNLENILNPKKSYKLFIVLNWVFSAMITLVIVLPLLFKIIFHNYLDYLYFEFNIGLELKQYLSLFYKILFNIYLIINILTLHYINKNIFYNYWTIRIFYIVGTLYMFSYEYLLCLFFILISFFCFEIKNIYTTFSKL